MRCRYCGKYNDYSSKWCISHSKAIQAWIVSDEDGPAVWFNRDRYQNIVYINEKIEEFEKKN